MLAIYWFGGVQKLGIGCHTHNQAILPHDTVYCYHLTALLNYDIQATLIVLRRTGKW